MIDDILFQRGHINVRIEDRPIDDYDIVISEHYFEGILGCTGEVIDSNGSDYKLGELTADDYFDIMFTVDEVEYETINGTIVSFEELIVRCTGQAPKPMSIDVYKLNGGFVCHTPIHMAELKPIFRDGVHVDIKDTMDEIRQRVIKESIHD